MTHDIVSAGENARARSSSIDIQSAAGAAAAAPISRRNLMNMMTKLAASTALLAPLAAAPAAAARDDRAGWNAAMAKLEALTREGRTTDKAFHEAWAKFEAARPSMDVINWKDLPFYFNDKHHVARSMDVEAEWAQFLELEGRTWFAPDPAAEKARRRAALDSVLEFRRLEREAGQRTKVDQLGDKSDALGNAICDAQAALIKTPAPDTEALLWKMEHLFGEDGRSDGFGDPWHSDLLDAVMADARRFLSAGRA